MGDTHVLDDRSQVLILAAEMAAEQGVDLAAFLDANPDALEQLHGDDAPIDLTDDEGEPSS